MARFVDGVRLGRLGALVAVSTMALTASFVGLVALASGSVEGSDTRLPVYVLAAAVVFVGGIVAFEESSHEGRRALWAATVTGVATFVVAGLGGEGVVYTLSNPDAVLRSQLSTYLLSAGLMGTGFGYWGWRNWSSLRASGLGDAL